MTPEQREQIISLREEGYAVIVWTPDELRGAKAHKVQDRSIELGWDIIADLAPVEPVEGL